MLVGGNRISGIHGAHFGPGVHIRFAAADAVRQTIPWVEYRNTNTGDVRTFVSPETQPDSAKALPTFEMECVDCHNRPTHTFDLPERAMDKALALGDIAVGLPYIKKQSVELLKANYATGAEAAAKLPPALAAFYQQNYPDLYAARSQDIHQAGAGGSRDLQPQCFSGPESDLGHLPEQSWPYGLSRVLSVSRRLAYDRRWKNDHSGLQHVS